MYTYYILRLATLPCGKIGKCTYSKGRPLVVSDECISAREAQPSMWTVLMSSFLFILSPFAIDANGGPFPLLTLPTLINQPYQLLSLFLGICLIKCLISHSYLVCFGTQFASISNWPHTWCLSRI